MATYAQTAGELLVEAAAFFRNLAETNESISEKMLENAAIFEQVAELIINNPQGVLNDTTHAELASRLMVDSAKFFKDLAEENPQIKDQMLSNAEAYEKLGELVMNDPMGILPEEA